MLESQPTPPQRMQPAPTYPTHYTPPHHTNVYINSTHLPTPSPLPTHPQTHPPTHPHTKPLTHRPTTHPLPAYPSSTVRKAPSIAHQSAPTITHCPSPTIHHPPNQPTMSHHHCHRPGTPSVHPLRAAAPRHRSGSGCGWVVGDGCSIVCGSVALWKPTVGKTPSAHQPTHPPATQPPTQPITHPPTPRHHASPHPTHPSPPPIQPVHHACLGPMIFLGAPALLNPPWFNAPPLVHRTCS